jgi:diguanylate cyclase (GGDEF)-like protein
VTGRRLRGWRLRPDFEGWLRDPRLTGRLGGALYVIAGLCSGAVWLVKSVPVDHPALLATVAMAAVVYGVLSAAVIDWERAPTWVVPLGTLAGVAATGLAAYASGGFESPLRGLGVFAIVYAAWFLPVRVALLVTLCWAATYGAPLLYDGWTAGRLAVTLVHAAIQFTVATVLLLGRALLRHLEATATRLSEEHALLRNLATAVAGGASLDELVAHGVLHVRLLCGADAAAIVTFEHDRAHVRAVDPPGLDGMPVGRVVPVDDGSLLDLAFSGGRAERRDGAEVGPVVAGLGFRSAAAAPVTVGRRPWGAIVAAGATDLPRDAVRRLEAVAELIGLAVGNAEAEERLVEQAATDPLTGLLNHRTFHERLRAELARAHRHGHPLTVAFIDLDHFKAVNDHLGHAAGDRMLTVVARRLQSIARAEDVLARIGGDEFALLMPETGEREAQRAIERARRAVGEETAITGAPVRLSAGLCGLEHAADADELVRLADGALYWAKAHGRDMISVYDPAVVRELSAGERAETLRRFQGMLGLRALARAIDAKDPSTLRHAERVAELACAVAAQLGWPADRIERLEEAALVHDVGKIGVPDAILLKPGRLDEHEYAQVQEHAALGARIVEDVLDPEQVGWVRWHHERPDGQGYPDGLGAAELPEGAAILACCDAFDVMTAERPYSRARPVLEGLAECERLAGQQFVGSVITALRLAVAPASAHLA